MERLFKEYKKRCLPCSFMVAEYLKIFATIIGVIFMCVFAFNKCEERIFLTAIITVLIVKAITILLVLWNKKNNKYHNFKGIIELLLAHSIDLSNTAQIDRLLDYIKEKKNRSTFLARFSTSILLVFSIIISAIGIDRETIFDFKLLSLFILISTIAIFILDFSLGLEGLSGLVNKSAYSQFYEDLNELLILDEATIRKYCVNVSNNTNGINTEYIVTIADLNDKNK